MKIYEVFKKIQETAGTNDKKQILKENVGDVIKQIFEERVHICTYCASCVNVMNKNQNDQLSP